ncbi:MAG: redoxin domain-containing protein [Bacteroidales bacterium]|nr:redoxin domain-containing protein [Bacteroidales bacterium]
MSRFSRFMFLAAAAIFAAACTDGAKIEGTLEGASTTDVVVKLLNVNRFEVLDTVKTDAAGHFTYKMDVAKSQPEFVYLFHKDTKVASLLLEAGDKVKVQADTLGNYSVEGSVESEKLAQVEKDFAAAYDRLETLVEELSVADAKDAAELQSAIGKEYLNYYRDRVRYVMTNSSSLTVIPVLYQNFGPELPVFGQSTDAIHFRNAADSLEMVYPDSKYVKALRAEADKRCSYLEVAALLSNAQEIGYPEIELPDYQGNKVKLSDVESKAKVTMLFFWNPSNTSQKMFNLDVLKSVYADYHKRGFEIYQVALDPDKAMWAKVVKEQALPWVNVCDGLGAQSPYVLQYNLGALPAAYIISDGALVDGQVVDEKSLRKLINNLLK